MARSPWRTLTAPGVCFPFPWTESSGRSKRGRGPVVPSRFWCARGGALPTWDGLGRRRIWPAQPRVEGMSAQAKLEEAVRWYQSLSAHLPHVQDRGVVSGGGQAHWIQFSR